MPNWIEKRDYAGPAEGIVCQGGSLSDRCYRPVVEYGPVKVAKEVLMLYHCPLRHYFVISRVPSHKDLSGAKVYIFPEPVRPSFGARL